MSMLRHRASAESRVPTRLLYSVRSPEEAIYNRELERLQAMDDSLGVFYTFTRSRPPGWTGYARRIDAPMLSEVAGPLGANPHVYICGPTAMVEAAANGLVQAGIAAGNIRTERFGPSGS
jgi:ferredoxin-NADP reductase